MVPYAPTCTEGIYILVNKLQAYRKFSTKKSGGDGGADNEINLGICRRK